MSGPIPMAEGFLDDPGAVRVASVLQFCRPFDDSDRSFWWVKTDSLAALLTKCIGHQTTAEQVKKAMSATCPSVFRQRWGIHEMRMDSRVLSTLRGEPPTPEWDRIWREKAPVGIVCPDAVTQHCVNIISSLSSNGDGVSRDELMDVLSNAGPVVLPVGTEHVDAACRLCDVAMSELDRGEVVALVR